jgi:hypothetical protein
MNTNKPSAAGVAITGARLCEPQQRPTLLTRIRSIRTLPDWRSCCGSQTRAPMRHATQNSLPSLREPSFLYYGFETRLMGRALALLTAISTVGVKWFSPGGEISPSPNLRFEPLNSEKTSNIQHPTSNTQWVRPVRSLDVGCSMLDVGCSQGVHGEGRGEGGRHTLCFAC